VDQPLPGRASAHDLLQATALMWAHAMGLQSSKLLACKKFQLALKMLFSITLWQPVTTLPT